MQPPAKRLRVLKPARIDASDAEYERKKQEAQEELKSKFESIFAKYENMPESMSDVVDLAEGKLVVDNGHYRRLEKDPKAWEAAQFLGEFIDNRVACDDDSADELAPPELSKPLKPKTDKQRPSGESAQLAVPTAQREPEAPPLATDQTQLLNALVQIPQTPVNQQNQDALLKSLGQIVLQTISQVLPQALSNHLAGTAINTLNSATTPVPSITSASRTVIPPATDPKWYYPPLPDAPSRSALPQSSPIPGSTSIRKRKRSFPGLGDTRRIKGKPGPTIAQSTSVQEASGRADTVFGQEDNDELDLIDNVHEEMGELHQTPEDVSGNWVSEDDVPDQSLEEEEPQEEYGSALQASAMATPAAEDSSKQRRNDDHQPLKDDLPSSPVRQRQLPTPNSLANSDGKEAQRCNGVSQHSNIVTPRPMYSDEDLELLSLAGGDEPLNDPTTDTEDLLEASVPPDEIVIPSIETVDFMDGDFQQQRITTHPRVEIRVRAPKVLPKIEPVVEQTTPPNRQDIMRRKQKSKPTNFTGESDSEDLDLVPIGQPLESEAKTNKPAPSNPHLPDELDAPFTPHIKRESSTPGPSSLLTVPLLKTPKSAPQPGALGSPAGKETSKLSKSQFARRARAMWAKQGRSGTPQTVRRRFSLQGVKPKRWQEDSEDELA